MELSVKNNQGETVDSIQVDDAVFDVPMNQTLLHQALVIYGLNQRQGTHDTKTRGEVSGGGRKPWTQKHTGRARQGSIRSPQWRHGGVVFGPHPRDYRRDLPRRMRHSALRCALSEKARRGNIVCIQDMQSIDGKTKSMVQLLANLGISGSCLVVTQGSQTNVVQAAHNVKKAWTLPVELINCHELLRKETLIITVDAIRKAEELWASQFTRVRGQRTAGAGQPVAVVEAATPEPDVAPSADTEAAPPRRRRRSPASEEGTE